MGLQQKLPVGEWARPAFAALHGLRGLRGTALDPFGRAHLRREEREAINWYRALVRTALAHLRRDNYEIVAEIARLPDQIRGYETIKQQNMARARVRAGELLAQLEAAPAALPVTR
jgi:indolepyruvate ferredoxin oxidoreductase